MNYTNHLSGETSPYLLQHADNPVDWYPWCPEALAIARRDDKPILLSIGYSACHWCHVMAHESFADPDTARLLNALFVNIKVDREERPDLDSIYQTAHQLLTQRSGGWPLTMFLTPDRQIPFFGGTYFPRQQRHGLPAFTDLCRRVSDFYRDRHAEIDRQNRSLIAFMTAMNQPEEHGDIRLTAGPLDSARQQLEDQFDPRSGGFGKAPKFPHPTSIEFLLRYGTARQAHKREDRQALHMALFTLDNMARGGMYDQLGGGFCRYSVDAEWMIPHFEKMLYDNGPLVSLYAEAYALTDRPLYRRIVIDTVAWLKREMQAPGGAFYSSLDADSEGEEGRFYLWSREQVKSILSADEYPVIADRFGFDREANFAGRWNPHVDQSVERIADRFGKTGSEIRVILENGRQKLLAAREQRTRPGRDEKILVAWNALMIRGLARASRYLAEPALLPPAEQALQYIRKTLWRNGRLLATSKDGRAHLNAYLDDYVFLADAILELLQVRWRSADLQFALELVNAVLDHFGDDNGGFYFTSDDHEELIQRPKPLTDNAMPAGNAIAARVLGRLGHLMGHTGYLDAAEATLKAAWQPMQQYPQSHAGLLLALEEHLEPLEIIVLRGNTPDTERWQAHAARTYAPHRMCFAIPDDITDLPGLLAERAATTCTVAYICRGQHCEPPVTDLHAFRQAVT